MLFVSLSQLGSTRSHEATHRKSEHPQAHSSAASKQTTSQLPVEDKASRKHQHGSRKPSKPDSSGQKTSARSSGKTLVFLYCFSKYLPNVLSSLVDYKIMQRSPGVPVRVVEVVVVRSEDKHTIHLREVE